MELPVLHVRRGVEQHARVIVDRGAEQHPVGAVGHLPHLRVAEIVAHALGPPIEDGLHGAGPKQAGRRNDELLDLAVVLVEVLGRLALGVEDERAAVGVEIARCRRRLRRSRRAPRGSAPDAGTPAGASSATGRGWQRVPSASAPSRCRPDGTGRTGGRCPRACRGRSDRSSSPGAGRNAAAAGPARPQGARRMAAASSTAMPSATKSRKVTPS